MSELQAQFYGGPKECPIENGRIQAQRIAPKISDVGGIPVARAIPQKERRLIGPWCFLDHIGPITDGPQLNVHTLDCKPLLGCSKAKSCTGTASAVLK